MESAGFFGRRVSKAHFDAMQTVFVFGDELIFGEEEIVIKQMTGKARFPAKERPAQSPITTPCTRSRYRILTNLISSRCRRSARS